MASYERANHTFTELENASNFNNGVVEHGNRVSRDLRSLVSDRKARNDAQQKPLEASTFLQRGIIAVKYRCGPVETNYRPRIRASKAKKNERRILMSTI